jgi:lysophospholipase L1-like esterase
MIKTVCVFGDSITWGSYDINQGGWVERLKVYLMKEDIDAYNCGISGDDTDDLLERFDVECKAREPELIIFAIGINDSHRNVPLEKFEENVKSLIGKARKYSKNIVYVGLTPVNNSLAEVKEDNYINDKIKIYNSKIKSICQKEKILFLEIFDDWIKADYKRMLYDGLHPNSKGHDKIFQAVKEFLNENFLQ